MIQKKAFAFAIIILASILLFFPTFQPGALLSSTQIETDGLYPVVIVALFIAFAYVKRAYITTQIQNSKPDSFYAVTGIVVVIASVMLSTYSNNPTFLMLCILLYGLGIFSIIFGSASILVSASLSIVVFATALPEIMSVLLEPYYSNMNASITYGILYTTGIPVTINNNVITIISSNGEQIGALINSACSGTASLSVFLVIFTLMLLDLPLPAKPALIAFIIGIAGTIFQNIARLAIVIMSGYLWGSDTMLYIHSFAGYVIFPVWYSIFAMGYVETYKRYTRRFVQIEL